MKILTVHRASDGERTAINIAENLGDVAVNGHPPSPSALAHLITFEGDAIADALFHSLPQATGQRLMFRLMLRYATNYLGAGKK